MSAIEEERQKAALAERARKRGLQPWQLEMVETVDDATVRSLVSDFRGGPSQPSSIAGAPAVQHKKQGGSGWNDPLPLSNPPGVNLADRLMDQQDQIDRIRRKRMLKGLPPDAA
jgi:hypothetical protein